MEETGAERRKINTEKKQREKPAKRKKKKRFHIDIFPAWCKQCGICVAFCPEQSLALDDIGYPYAESPEKCIGCIQCELRCPDFAITVIEEEERKERPSGKRKGLRQGVQVS
ncbi:MAG: 4Fe-4S dicluster domain-containing protein [Deltaproteobacteria bacterium]|nr:MAG: 4Fe-4S dicluster domain-containing protein [Deltaproteobacteria bacterium]